MMTGKCKTDFQEWIFQKYGDMDTPVDFERNYIIVTFSRLSHDHQQGDLLAFFRDKGYYIEIAPVVAFERVEWDWWIYEYSPDKKLLNSLEEFHGEPDYSAAFNEAISKAVEIYNGGVK